MEMAQRGPFVACTLCDESCQTGFKTECPLYEVFNVMEFLSITPWKRKRSMIFCEAKKKNSVRQARDNDEAIRFSPACKKTRAIVKIKKRNEASCSF